ncbi:hypothetical protein SUGI_0792430 [Cryptomeria japonica]|nr:hypothetical protein SUGI_0792430 [Cryptomeria japonica]
MTMVGGRFIIDLEEEWERSIQIVIKKLFDNLEKVEIKAYCGTIYTSVYNLSTQKSTQKPPHDYPKQLYDRYRETIEDYITKTVLPALRKTSDKLFLRELMKQWENYRTMVRWLPRLFAHLDLYFVKQRSLPTLNEVCLTCFCDLVQEIRDKVKDALITLIHGESEGKQTDQILSENIDSIIVDSWKDYGKDFEVAMLELTASYYSRKAALWFEEKSDRAYLEKVNDCLKRLGERVDRDLHSSSKEKWLEKVQNKLLSQCESWSFEKEYSECRKLLRDGKVEDLSDMYKLFHRIPKGLCWNFQGACSW